MSKSGCTTVLVDGPMTPNFARQPSTSLMVHSWNGYVAAFAFPILGKDDHPLLVGKCDVNARSDQAALA